MDRSSEEFTIQFLMNSMKLQQQFTVYSHKMHVIVHSRGIIPCFKGTRQDVFCSSGNRFESHLWHLDHFGIIQDTSCWQLHFFFSRKQVAVTGHDDSKWFVACMYPRQKPNT